MGVCLGGLLVAVCLVGGVRGVLVEGDGDASDTAQMAPKTYRVGKECDEDMSSTDPLADDMPHNFPEEVTSASPLELERMMNANPKDGVSESKSLVSETAAPAPVAGALAPKLQIPYDAAPPHPAQRRPCNLDRVLALLGEVRTAFSDEAKAESAFAKGSLADAISAARGSLESARDAVSDLKRAQSANETVFVKLAAVDSKAQALRDRRELKADLLEQEGALKVELVRHLGSLNVEVRDALANKRSAVGNFANQVTKTPGEKAKTIAKFDQLVANLKGEMETVNKEATETLAPIQLSINRTDVEIARLESEIATLNTEIDGLVPVAAAFSAAALAAAKDIEADALAHYNALEAAAEANAKGSDTRDESRQAVDQLAADIIATVVDIQKPSSPGDEYASVDSENAPDDATPLPPSH